MFDIHTEHKNTYNEKQTQKNTKARFGCLVRPLPGNGASPTLQLLGRTQGSSRVVCIYITLCHSLVEGAPIVLLGLVFFQYYAKRLSGGTFPRLPVLCQWDKP